MGKLRMSYVDAGAEVLQADRRLSLKPIRCLCTKHVKGVFATRAQPEQVQ